MIGSVGHLQVLANGVATDGGWRGQWTIHQIDRAPDAQPGMLLLVDDGETPEVYGDQMEAGKAAHEMGMARAQEIYDER